MRGLVALFGASLEQLALAAYGVVFAVGYVASVVRRAWRRKTGEG